MSERNLGCFVSCAGGLYKILDAGDELGVNTVMTHPAPPQRWNSQPFKQETVEKYIERKAQGTHVQNVYFHGIYLVNLANPDSQKFHLSKLSVMHHLDLCEKIDAQGVIFHTGTFKDYTDDELGYERVAYGINWIFDNVEVKGRKMLLECAAGAGGRVIGDKLEELQRIYNDIDDKNKDKVGFCLDTQHMFASGYDFVSDIDAVVEEVDKRLGLEKVMAVHFNDSKSPLGSNVDRHENLGEGQIGEAGMKAFLNHPKLKNKDFILETPALKDLEGSAQQVKILKKWASD
jgi:deoxyribonuclease IV